MNAVSAPSSHALAESLRRAPVVRFNGYEYFIHPLTDGIPSVTPELLAEAAEGLRRLLPREFDRLFTAEAMGIPVATALALAAHRPYLVARKRSYGLPGEIVVAYRTGYSKGTYYVNDLRPGERIVLVDDVLSTGGTLRALAQAIRMAGARLVKSVVLFNKGLDVEALGLELGAPVEALLRLRVENGTVRVNP